MVPFVALAGLVAVLGLLWVAVSAWILAGRALHDRRRRGTIREADLLVRDPGAVRALSTRHLWRIADGPAGPAAIAAARELQARSPQTLLGAARRGGTLRTHALRILARSGSPLALDCLREAHREGGADLTAAVVAIAGELDASGTTALLFDVLVAGDHPRSRTATELAPRAAALLDRLVDLARHDDPALRYWAVMLLQGAARTPAARAAAHRAAADPDAGVRSAAARVLGAGGSTDELPVVRALLRDEVFFVRAHAARAVGELGGRELSTHVAELLADESWWVRAAAKETLVKLGDPGFEAAVDMLGHADRFACDSAAEVVFSSGRLLDMADAVKTGDPWAATALAAILVDLSVLGDEASSEPLQRLAV
jgi:hypothetical protein